MPKVNESRVIGYVWAIVQAGEGLRMYIILDYMYHIIEEELHLDLESCGCAWLVQDE
jgi:hypothetical protein